MNDWWSQLFDFADYGALLVLVRNSIIAGAVLGIVGGLIGVFVMSRDLAFAVHGISELSFAGAAAGLLFGVDVVEGSIVGSLVAAAAHRAARRAGTRPQLDHRACSCRSGSASASCASPSIPDARPTMTAGRLSRAAATSTSTSAVGTWSSGASGAS